MNSLVLIAVLRSTLRQSTPITLGALSGLFCERVGVINIAIEGMMLTAAYMGYMTNVWTGNLILAVIVAVLSGGLMALLHAWLSIHFKVDQIISGTVINILAVGLTGYFYQPGTVTKGKLQSVAVPVLTDIPIIGDVFFDNGPLTYAAVVLVFAVNIILFRTRWGLRMRAVGEHPRAADTLGINVFAMRYINVVIGGMLAGLGGAYLTLEAVGSFERLMTNGRGFISLAAMIFGKWTPFGGWAAALLFGAANAVQTQIQFSGDVTIPHQFIGMLPYVLTVIVLAGFVGRARPPAAIGRPYETE
ncbi:MAG: ABC transporter permease [Anaerolineales bacterium]|jgi:simple sugar transport system permease protein|nr:ABC transporter permease [Anaerolineaceae bacterium]MDP6224983.1 ABC transporter permease [Anaerolineales bacterium]MDP7644403.1 ABC transporter permease [Anaerolineales bacterium]|tara:strand:- start:643 stop:1551 length:909 start_codon:yes stop_codon:yes gene_type:complete